MMLKLYTKFISPKYFAGICFTAFLLGSAASPVSAKDTNLGHISASDLKISCEAGGGRFTMTPDGENWICTKKCGDGYCVIICDYQAGCSGHTPDKSVDKLPVVHTISDVLDGKIIDGEGGKKFLWAVALVGLIGISVLFLLMKRRG